jgi:hypothetical protein
VHQDVDPLRIRYGVELIDELADGVAGHHRRNVGPGARRVDDERPLSVILDRLVPLPPLGEFQARLL